MPKYVFECKSCSVRFDRILKIGDYLVYPCPSCKEDAQRVFSGNGFGFGFSAPSGSAIANTGVHDNDYPTADKAVGRSAEQKWGIYNERNAIKSKVRKEGNSYALTRIDGNDDIKYSVMSRKRVKERKEIINYADKVRKS
jgi:putative FmdB family regulatory protein